MLYLKPFIFSFLAVCALVPLIYWAAIKFFKWPKRPRDAHLGNIPRWGGVALILVFWLAVFLDKNLVIDKPLWGLLVGSAIILIFGIWDDLKELKPRTQLVIQVLLALIIIVAGISVDYLRNPFGGVIRLDQFGFLFIIAWIVLIMNVVNWLDGLDGLASGVSLVGFVVIFLLSISSIVNQPPIGILSIILVGALLGFLIFNFPRRRGSIIFLGTSGSIFLGFILGSLSIYSGSKVATAGLVLGVAVLDAIWVIWQRLKNGVPIWKSDQRHLHHQLLKLGFGQRHILGLYLVLSAAFGAIALISGTQGKFLAFLGLCAIMISLVYGIRNHKDRRKTI
jgi:UDP-GlcNAc:undecaprenyl-phosphate GlcNAc-1-phosphate transferase